MVKTYHCTTLFKAIRLMFKIGGRIQKLQTGWGVTTGPRTVTPLPLVNLVKVQTVYGERYDVVLAPKVEVKVHG